MFIKIYTPVVKASASPRLYTIEKYLKIHTAPCYNLYIIETQRMRNGHQRKHVDHSFAVQFES